MEIKTKNKKNEVKAVDHEIKVNRAHQFEDGSVAIDLDVNGVSIYNAVLREGKNGMFVSWPSRKGKDDKYYSHVFVKLSEADIKSIIEQVEEL